MNWRACARRESLANALPSCSQGPVRLGYAEPVFTRLLKPIGAALLAGALLAGPGQGRAQEEAAAPAAVPASAAAILPKAGAETSPSETSEPEPGYKAAYQDYRNALIAQDFETALIYARKGHALALRDLGLRHAQTGVLAYNLGAVSYRLKRYRDALAPLLEAEQTYAENYGLDSKKNLLPVRKLAATSQALGNWPEAERYSVRAMEIIEAERGRTAPEITEILLDLTKITQNLGQAKRMRTYANRALYNMHQSEDPKALAIGHAYITLATAEIMLGDAVGVNKSLDRAIEIYEIHFSADDAQLLGLYAFAAETFEQTGRTGSARKYRRRLNDSEN